MVMNTHVQSCVAVQLKRARFQLTAAGEASKTLLPRLKNSLPFLAELRFFFSGFELWQTHWHSVSPESGHVLKHSKPFFLSFTSI